MRTNTILTREDSAFLDFSQACEGLRRIVDDGQRRALLDFTNVVIDAIGMFGVSEHYYRQSERYKALNIHQAQADFLQETGVDFNNKGLRILSQARDTLGQLKEELATYPTNIDISGLLDAAERDFKERLVTLEIKASDVKQISIATEECLNIARGKSATGLYEFLAYKITQLENARQQPDRGAADNIAWWKVVALVAMFGMFIWALVKCGFFGCTVAEAGFYAFFIAAAAVIANFC